MATSARLVGGDRADPRTREEVLAGLMRAPGLAGKVRTATTAPDAAGGSAVRIVPVRPELAAVLPDGGLRRGSTMAITSGTGLLIELMAAVSKAGGWCAVIGMPTLSALAADAAGVSLDRLALVPKPGPGWAEAVAALVDGFDMIVVEPALKVPAALAGRLDARVRQRGAVLLVYGAAEWPGADVRLGVDVAASTWHGIGPGRGRLRWRELVITAQRGHAAPARRGTFTIGERPVLPAGTGLRVVPTLPGLVEHRRAV